MYLVDTNVWLERLLDQNRSEDVARFLAGVPSGDLCMTDFSFHSIVIVLQRLGRFSDLSKFANDLFRDGAVRMIRLGPEATDEIIRICGASRLDFDDGYQYAAAARYDLTIVSFDSDFDRTERKRLTPSQVS